jgi:hypothetical protein
LIFSFFAAILPTIANINSGKVADGKEYPHKKMNENHT